jgi:hypothetical protein
MSRAGAFFLMLFGSLFLAGGIVAAALTLRGLERAQDVKGWRQAPATIQTCELARHRGSKGGCTYEVKATYRYEVDGVSHTGDRVWLGSGSDNIGDFHQRAYAELQRGRDGVEPTVCWVNPRDPADAVLIRKPRLELLFFYQLFVLAFGGAGLGVVLAGLVALFQPSAPKQAFEGGTGQLRMRGASSHRVAAALALAWNGYVGWFLWRAWQVAAPEPLPWWFWLFALTGAIPAAIAFYLVGRMRKFGVSVLEMSPLPGVLGGPVGGTIRIPAAVVTEAGFTVKLQCVHQYTTGSGKHRSTHRDVLWEEARHIDRPLACGDETMLQVRFSAPYELPATTVAGGRNGYYWQLTASAAAPGIDYKAVFDVPVRHTAQSSQAPAPERAPGAACGGEPVSEAIARERLRLEPRADGGFELTFPAGRARAAWITMAVMAAVWTAVCVLLWSGAKVPDAIKMVFTAVDALLLYGLYQALFVVRGVVVDRARQTVVLWWRAPGVARRERALPFGAVADVRSERAGQVGNALFYRVVLALHAGAPATVGSGLTMWADAENVAELLRAALRPAFSLDDLRV